MVKLGDLMRVERSDILDFPGDTIELILDLQKEGWRAQRSNRNHVMLLAPDGVTRYSASRNANSAKYLAEDVARYKKGDKLGSVDEEGVIKKPEKANNYKIGCPQVDCGRFFNSQEKVNVHLAVDHEGHLKCPDCDETREDKRKLSIHRTRSHGYVSPRYARRKQQEANRAAKKTEGEKLTPEIIEMLRGEPVDLEKELGRSVGPLPNYLVDADGAVHDVVPIQGEASKSTGRELSSSHVSLRDIPMTDTMDVHHLIKDEDRVSLKGTVIPTDKVETVDFIDERDSWVMDISDLRNRRVGNIEQLLKAAGLEMEIRVWKK